MNFPQRLSIRVRLFLLTGVPARREEEKQREHFAIFQRVAEDRDGFIAFCAEMEVQLDRLAGVTAENSSVLALLHTVKSNALTASVARITLSHAELDSRDQARALLPRAGDGRGKRFVFTFATSAKALETHPVRHAS